MHSYLKKNQKIHLDFTYFNCETVSTLLNPFSFFGDIFAFAPILGPVWDLLGPLSAPQTPCFTSAFPEGNA